MIWYWLTAEFWESDGNKDLGLTANLLLRVEEDSDLGKLEWALLE